MGPTLPEGFVLNQSGSPGGWSHRLCHNAPPVGTGQDRSREYVGEADIGRVYKPISYISQI